VSPRATAWGAYSEIAATLRERVASGEYAPGASLPSEAALCAEFGVVRNTVRRALAELEQEGLIETSPGRGRVVRTPGEESTSSAEGRALARYRRISADLRAAIESGELQPGDVLPSEAALVERYGVSRGTARQALADLEGAGLIESKHGKGRFVRRTPGG
jgi:DNA-binding GntR family transcriptional regulator